MIKLVNDYAISATSECYVLGKLKKNKEGKDILTNTTYPTTLKSAINTLLQKEQRRIVKEEVLTLKQTVEKFEELQKQFSQLLENTIKEAIKED